MNHNLPICASLSSWGNRRILPHPAIGWHGVSWTFWPGWPQSMTFLILLDSQVTRITDFSHQLHFNFLLMWEWESLKSHFSAVDAACDWVLVWPTQVLGSIPALQKKNKNKQKTPHIWLIYFYWVVALEQTSWGFFVILLCFVTM
jgi:hypothetical protein